MKPSGTLTNTSTTYTTTTLKAPENRRTVALLVEAMVEMAGRQLDAQPTVVKQGLHGEALGDAMTVKNLPPEEIVVEGQRMMQATSDIMLGWDRVVGLDGHARDFHVRQLWDWKASADIESMVRAARQVTGAPDAVRSVRQVLLP